MKLRIGHFYPDLLNLYGDRGNLLALQKRCQWRGIDCQISPIHLNEPLEASDHDLFFIGGGQDDEQNLLQEDFLRLKGPVVKAAVEAGSVFLCICGGFQMMGRYYEKTDGSRIEGLGALDHHTVAGENRLIGDCVSRSDLLAEQGKDSILVGFENHAGRTFLGPQTRPLAKVQRGHGNNGQDGQEGAIYKNVYCTYYHGSFLPKNPAMADYLIHTALQKRFEGFGELEPLDDSLEENARNYIKTCK